MRLRLSLFLIAIVSAMIGTVLIAIYIGGLESRVFSDQKLTNVYVATRRVAKGTPAIELIARGLIRQEKIPSKFVTSGAIKSLKSVKNKFLAVPLEKGEQVTKSVLTEPPSGLKTPQDMLAIAIPIDDLALMDGRVKAGGKVAVLITLKPGKDEKDISKILIDSSPVLAVNRAKSGQTGGSQSDKSSIVLGVTPENAEKLVFAASQGTVWVGLWPPGVSPKLDTPGQTLDTLY